MTEIVHDAARNQLWIGHNTTTAGTATITTANPATLAPNVPTIVVDEMDAGGGSPAGPDVDGAVTGLSLLSNGNLLCTDNQGDGLRFSDTIFEVDPTIPGLVSFWYTNGRICAACRPNTNIDVPTRDLFAVSSITASGGGPIFVTRALNNRGTTVLTRVELTPGVPGTWRLLQDVPTPCAAPASGLAFDRDQAAQNGLPNAYWFVSSGNHHVYECTWTGTAFLVNQVFPAPLQAATTSNRIDSFVAPIVGSAGPHELVVGETSAALATSMLAKVAAGTGAPDVPLKELHIYHSTLSTNLYNPTDPVVFNEEVQLWRPGIHGSTSEWTTEQSANYVFPLGSATIGNDVDALAIDPAFVGDDPTFFEMYWSERGDMPTANGGGFLDGDVVRYRRDGTKEVLIDEATIRTVLGIAAATAINTDGLAILPGGDLLLSFSDTSLANTNPNFAGSPILDGDVVVIPAARAANSGYWVWREAEFGPCIANALGTPAFTYAELDGLEIDPNGNGARPNPHLPATTRPDILFTVDYTTTLGVPSGWTRNHVFSTRLNGAADGAIVRDARTMGYGVVGGLASGLIVDALAVPRVNPSTNTPITDVFAQANAVPAGTQIVRLVGRNLPPNDPAVLFFIGVAPLVPTIDAHPVIRHNPLMVVPIANLPAVADQNGLAELRFDLPMPIGGRFYIQVGTVTGMALGTLARITLL
jgi:hypothetical protein